jgi:2-keto-3-deoxy-L-rhamnonate aldolase RhmA
LAAAAGEDGRGRVVSSPEDGGGRAPLVGTVVSLPDVALAELTASMVGFVWIDLEHGALCAADVQPLAIAARAGGAASLVRVGSPGDGAVGQALDAGVDGIVVPHVDSARDAEQVVRRLRHPPRGSRGVAARRALGYGVLAVAGIDRVAHAADPVLMAQVESAAGVEAARAIAEVDGVDALVVGVADLAADLAADTDEADGPLGEAIARVQEACEAAGVAFGVAGPDDPGRLVELAGGRAALLVLGADVRVYARALRDAFAHLSAIAAQPEEAHVRA